MANRRKVGTQGKKHGPVLPHNSTQSLVSRTIPHLHPKSFMWTSFDTREESFLIFQLKKEEYALEFASFSNLYSGKTSYFKSKRPILRYPHTKRRALLKENLLYSISMYSKICKVSRWVTPNYGWSR